MGHRKEANARKRNGDGCRKAIVTGAAGFVGTNLVNYLLENGYRVCGMVTPGSVHNARLWEMTNLRLIEANLVEMEADQLAGLVDEEYDYMFHLAWTGARNDIRGQVDNLLMTTKIVSAAKHAGCKRIICTGSQAEYGQVASDTVQEESLPLFPVSAYGAAKTAACQLSRVQSEQLNMDWIWARLFSVIGTYEPRGRMLPDLYHSLKQNRGMKLSSCRQNWDFLDVRDAAEALVILARYGKDGEIYNVANGAYAPLIEYTEKLRGMINRNARIEYGDDPSPFISLQPSVRKIHQDTGWAAKRSFEDSIRSYEYESDRL